MVGINIKNGRDDLNDYFQKSGIREYKKLQHTPFVVLVPGESSVDVDIIDNAKKLLLFSDDTPVLAQWRGEWRSDYFRFTVGQLRQYVTDNPPSPHMIV